MATASSPATLGKSGLLLGGAKLGFLVSGYATTLVLSSLVDPAIFGSYAALARVVAIPNMVIVQSLLYTVSRPLAREYDQQMPSYHPLRRRGLKLAVALGGAVTIAMFAGAPAIAAFLEGEQLQAPLRWLAPITLFYAIYAVNVGTLNAKRLFRRQALLDILMSTTKAVLIILGALLGFGLSGISAGFTCASALALIVSFLACRRLAPAQTGEAAAPPAFDALIIVLLLSTGLTQVLQSVDVLLLKHFASSVLEREGAGFYSAAQFIAMVPASLLAAINLLLFPLVASFEGNDRAIRQLRARYAGLAFQVTLAVVVVFGIVLGFGAPSVVAALFDATYAPAADSLRWMAWGYGGYALLLNALWMLTGAGFAGFSCALTGGVLALTVGGHLWLTDRMGAQGAAWVVFATGVVAAASAWLALRWRLQAKIPLNFISRLFAVGVLTYAIVYAASASGLQLSLLPRRIAGFVQAAGLGIVTVLLCWVTGVVSRASIQELRRGNAS